MKSLRALQRSPWLKALAVLACLVLLVQGAVAGPVAGSDAAMHGAGATHATASAGIDHPHAAMADAGCCGEHAQAPMSAGHCFCASTCAGAIVQVALDLPPLLPGSHDHGRVAPPRAPSPRRQPPLRPPLA